MIMDNVVTTSANPVTKPIGAETPTDALGVDPSMSTSNGDTQESDEHKCPECGFTSETWHGVKAHYGKVHDGSLKQSKKCEWCGDEFDVKPHQSKTKRFCSKSCHYSQRRGFEKPTRQKLKKLYENEGLSLNRIADRLGVAGHQTVARWFDSYNLEYRGNAEANQKLNKERDDHDEIVKAAHKAVREAVENGEWHLQSSNPERNGYGEGWTEEKRELVREKYDRRCQSCGMSGKESLEKFGLRLDVHHIRPWGQFDDPRKRNAVENLVPLCRSCHRKWEGIPLRPEVVG